jgi:hypothetical protein
MKKSMFKISLMAFLMLIVFVTGAMADWSVTVNWTRSVGPGLASEQVFLDTVSKCTVTAPAPTTCQFTVPSLTGQSVKIRSLNAQGGFNETAPVILSAAPAPATGVLINITYVAP